MKELLDAVYKRKSVRKYSGKLSNEEYAQIEAYLSEIKPLVPDIKVEYEIVPGEETNCKFNAEHCLIVYSEEANLWLANVGYLIEQWELLLALMNVGVCWYGMGRVEEAERNGMKYAIMIAFGKTDEEFRSDESQFNRKKADEIWGAVDGETKLSRVAEIVKLAPSAVNSQPWKVVEEGNTLNVYREKSKIPVLSGILFKRWNKVDIGIFLALLEIALESEGYTFERTLHHDTNAKKSVLTATYTINK